MGTRGPKRNPNVRLASANTNPSRDNIDPPVPPQRGTPEPPPNLSEEAAEVWNELAPSLHEAGLLSAWDVRAFARYCELSAESQFLWQCINDAGGAAHVSTKVWNMQRQVDMALHRYSARFGLSPLDRQQLKVENPRPSASADRFRYSNPG